MAIRRTTKHTSDNNKPEDDGKPGSDTRRRPKRSIWETVVELGAQIPGEEWVKVPDDASINLDHCLYGAPKKKI